VGQVLLVDGGVVVTCLDERNLGVPGGAPLGDFGGFIRTQGPFDVH
jgi:hypothetical protein